MVASRGITVEKRLVTEGVDSWVVVLTVSNNNDTSVGVRLFEHLPETIDPDDVTFDDDHLGEQWEVDRDGRMVFGVSVDSEADRRTGYAVPADDTIRDDLLEPPEVADVVPLHTDDEGELRTRFMWGGGRSGTDADRPHTGGDDTSVPVAGARRDPGEPAESPAALDGLAGELTDRSMDATPDETVEDRPADRGDEPVELSDEVFGALETLASDEADEAAVGPTGDGGNADRTRVLSELLEALTREVEDLVSYTEVLESFLADESTAMEALEDVRSDVDGLSENLRALEREFDDVASTVAQRGERLDALEGSVDGLSSDVGTVRSSVEEVAAAVERISAEARSASELDERVSDLEEQVEAAADERAQILEAVEEISGAVEALEAKGVAHDDWLAELEADVESVATRVGTVERNLSEHRTAIAELRTDVQDVQAVFGRLADGLRSAERSTGGAGQQSGSPRTKRGPESEGAGDLLTGGSSRSDTDSGTEDTTREDDTGSEEDDASSSDSFEFELDL